MDLEGSKIAITLPTGRVLKFELMRVGAMEQYRHQADLLCKLDTDKASLTKLVEEIIGTMDELHEGQ